MNLKDYPKNWKEISKATIERAYNKCELCFAKNYSLIHRGKIDFITWKYPYLVCPYTEGDKYKDCLICSQDEKNKPTKIILTVHHINHNKQDNSKHNLISLCQRCHLRLDMAHHVKNRRESREKNQMKINLVDTKEQEIFKKNRLKKGEIINFPTKKWATFLKWWESKKGKWIGTSIDLINALMEIDEKIEQIKQGKNENTKRL